MTAVISLCFFACKTVAEFLDGMNISGNWESWVTELKSVQLSRRNRLLHPGAIPAVINPLLKDFSFML